MAKYPKPNITESHFEYLFLTLLAFFVLSPFLGSGHIGSLVVNILFSAVLVVSLYAIRFQKHIFLLGILLLLSSVISYWLAQINLQNKPLYTANLIISLVFFILTTSIVISYILRDSRVNLGTLSGAISGYLLIGLTWSIGYHLIYVLDDKSFFFTFKAERDVNYGIEYFVYYSFVTLTTLGFGDITPMNHVAKTFSWIEAVFGQVYLTAWLAQLVGAFNTWRLNNRKKT